MACLCPAFGRRWPSEEAVSSRTYRRAAAANTPAALCAVGVVPGASACTWCARSAGSTDRSCSHTQGRRPGSCWSNQPLI
ncbi:hypothetical protein NDU88_000900 [Pleurodeles waltl]|uniref:Uncharacterized protein n=1 Tax=Pleurodeles waltl TaxID=8319 RepID=A0AAV7VXW8_PLEWA|nr:hypothetical protein NDU88_000900 [Pleurodeles waltl]